MEEEIDLRPYLEKLIRHWTLIVGTVVAVAIVAFFVSSLLPSTYETTALIAVTEPSQLVRFEVGFDAIQEIVPRPLRAYPELAISDGLIEKVLEEVQPSLSEPTTLDALRDILIAESGDDLSLIRLNVQYQDPNVAALIANTWAVEFVSMANEIYGGSDGNQLSALEAQLEQTSSVLEIAEEELVKFQARNRLDIVSNELLSLQSNRSSLLQDRVSINNLLRDVRGLRQMLSIQPNDGINLSEQMTALFLQVDAFTQPARNAAGSVVFQLDSQTAVLTTASRSEQITLLNDLETTLSARLAELDDEIDLLEPQILSLQEERQAFTAEQNQLTRERDTAQEAYQVLARRVEEERISLQDVVEGVQLASTAAVPEDPISPRRLVNTAVAGAFVFVMMVVLLVVLEWWQRNFPNNETP